VNLEVIADIAQDRLLAQPHRGQHRLTNERGNEQSDPRPG